MLSDLISNLNQLGLPVTYGSWKEGQAPDLPYLIVLETSREDLAADDSKYYKVHTYNVEFYFEFKNPDIEDEIEAFFDNHEIPYAISEDTWIESERFFEKIYLIEIGE